MAETAPRSAIGIMIAGASAITALLLGTLSYWGLSARTTGDAAGQLLTNAVPSTKLLTAARSSLRRLDGALDLAVLSQETGQAEHVGSAISLAQASQKQMSADFVGYEALPAYAEEAELQHSTRQAMARLDTELALLLDALRREDVREVERLENGSWRLASDTLDALFSRLIVVNIQHAVEHAETIDRIEGRAAILAFIIAAAGTGLAVLAVRLAASAVRRQVSFEKERSAELEMFASRVAHDLMNPLSATGLTLQTIMRQGPPHDSSAKLAFESLKRACAIVDSLLDFARAGGVPDKTGMANVAEAIVDTIRQLQPEAERANIQLSHSELPACAVACPLGILSSVLDNLTRNAIKYMNASPIRRVELRARGVGPFVCFDVDDTGPGLPTGFEEHAFEAYLRGSNVSLEPGLGLGLATVRRLVTAYGGQVGVRKRTAGGSVFWFTLPQHVQDKLPDHVVAYD